MRGGPASREAVRRSRGGSGLLGTGASSAADGDRRRRLDRRRRPGSGATLWKLGSRMLEYHERPRSAYGKHRH
jgi:hypothetical protein